MRNLLLTIFFVFGIAGCGQTNDGGGTETLTGKLVFKTGEIVFSEKTLDGVCFDDAGERDLVAMVSLTPAGADDLFRLTSENVGGQMALRFRDQEYFNSTIQEPIEGRIPIAMVLVSPKEGGINEMEALFGVQEIKKCDA